MPAVAVGGALSPQILCRWLCCFCSLIASFRDFEIRGRVAASAKPSSRRRRYDIKGGFRTIVASADLVWSSAEPSTDAAIGGPDRSYLKL